MYRFDVVLFVFFKQKTAYGLRISDWSSDVCSSDLVCASSAPGVCSATGAVAGGAGLCGVRSAAGSGFGTAVSASRPAASGLAAGIGTGSAGLSIVAIGATAAGSVDLDVEVSRATVWRSEEHTSELQSLMRISYAVFCLKKKKKKSA